MRIAIDLLWLRPGKVGGTEFYVRNLLDGFCLLDDQFEFVLVLSKDNAFTFEHYMKDKRFSEIIAPIDSANIAKRIIWQNLFQNRLLRRNHIKTCFTPVYCRPIFNGFITYINTIHDIQAYHYPQYHPLHEVLYSKVCWWVDVWKSKKIIAISNYVKKDIEEHYKVPSDKITVIHNSISADMNKISDFEKISSKWNIKKEQYYYTIAQMIPHKNLDTIIKVMSVLQDNGDGMSLPHTLVISGIGGNASTKVNTLIRKYHLENNVILTGFIQEEERNSLYANCKAFLFPSVFEGFGMPVVEAMAFGATVITTNKTSIPEVSQRKANYVSDPYDVDEWIELMYNPTNRSKEIDYSKYEKERIARQCLDLLMKK